MRYPDPEVFKELESAEEKPKNLCSFKQGCRGPMLFGVKLPNNFPVI